MFLFWQSGASLRGFLGLSPGMVLLRADGNSRDSELSTNTPVNKVECTWAGLGSYIGSLSGPAVIRSQDREVLVNPHSMG